jgi:hypothetical protein
VSQGPSPSDTSLEGFGLPRLRAVVLAYRAAKGEGLEEREAAEFAIAAYLRFGGTREEAGRDLYAMIAAVAAQHGEWFSRPERERHAREKAALQAAGWWPGPNDPQAYRELLERAYALMEARKCQEPRQCDIRETGPEDR